MLSNYDKIIFDFDDTIWSRDDKFISISIQNFKFINDFLADKAIIISGNSYKSIKDKLSSNAYVNNINIDIWADANSTLYRNGLPVEFIKYLSIDKSARSIKDYLFKFYNLSSIEIGYPEIVNLKIKPLSNLNRDLLIDLLNGYVFNKIGIKDCVAFKTGKTTVDILHKDNNKSVIFNYLNLSKYKTLYIGDEVLFGNDFDIANMCTDKISVSDVFDTSSILKLLGGSIS